MSTSAALQKRKARKIEQLKDLRARQNRQMERDRDAVQGLHVKLDELLKLQAKSGSVTQRFHLPGALDSLDV